jgi:hypothetical protein
MTGAVGTAAGGKGLTMQIGPVSVNDTAVKVGAGAAGGLAVGGAASYAITKAKLTEDFAAQVTRARFQGAAAGVAVGAGLALGIPALINAFD